MPIRFFVEHCATIEECVIVANCNESLIDARFELTTGLLAFGKDNT